MGPPARNLSRSCTRPPPLPSPPSRTPGTSPPPPPLLSRVSLLFLYIPCHSNTSCKFFRWLYFSVSKTKNILHHLLTKKFDNCYLFCFALTDVRIFWVSDQTIWVVITNSKKGCPPEDYRCILAFWPVESCFFPSGCKCSSPGHLLWGAQPNCCLYLRCLRTV